MPSLGYLYDAGAHAAANAREENYWFAYVEEICSQMGVAALPVSSLSHADLRRTLTDLRVLLVGDGRSADLTAAAEIVRSWVEQGGTLLGFASEGLDELFGNAYCSVTPQLAEGFAPTALLRLGPGPLTAGAAGPLFGEEVIPLFGPIRKVIPSDSEPLAELLNLRGAAAPFPGLTHRRVGCGQAFYFAADLAQTMWVLHKGRPIDGDYDLDGYLRIGDAQVTSGLPREVPHADLLRRLLQNLLHHTNLPLVHHLPPRDGEVTDLLLYFGGDDEGLTDGSQVAASDFMKSRGLPYHINIMPDAAGQFGLTRAEHDRIVGNGHEASLHYNFMDGFSHPSGFSREDVERQWGWFCAAFGHKPVATVTHWCRWYGWSEPAEWMCAVGGRADNSRFGVSSPPLNPTNTIGVFGSALPHYYYADWRAGNRRIDFLCEPIVAYEVGYGEGGTDFDTLHRALEMGADYQLTMGFFYHPIYIATRESCRQAVDELLRYVSERGWRAVYLGCDALWEWWDARRRSWADLVTTTSACAQYRTWCAGEQGMIVKIPAARRVLSVSVDGAATGWVEREHGGLPYALVVCPAGEHEVSVEFA